jgi:hypothetical protein
MATAHSTSKARSGRNRPSKSPRTRAKAPNRSKAFVKHRKTQPAQAARPHAKGVSRAGRQESESAERGLRIRVRGRLQDMLRAELFNLGKAEAVLRCLALSMDYEPLDHQSPYYPDVVEVAGDLVKRSIADLDALYDGRIPHPLTVATRNIER